MKRLLLPLLVFLIPSAHAVDYVQCEAIQKFIDRNSLEKEKIYNTSKALFEIKKLREKYPNFTNSDSFLLGIRSAGSTCLAMMSEQGYKNYKGMSEYKECETYEKNILSTFSKEYQDYLTSSPLLIENLKKDTKAKKDFKEKGCY